jgi:L-malate glycosyltransferase
MMKIMMVSGNPLGKDYGGVAVHVEFLTKYLSRFKDITLVSVSFGEENQAYAKSGIQYIVLKRMKLGKIFFPFQIFYDVLRLDNLLNKINPDVIHIQSTIPTFSLFGLYIARTKYKILLTLHGYFKEESKFHRGFEKIFNKLISTPLERQALMKIPNIITVCPQLKEIIQKFTFSNIYTVPNGIDIDMIQEIAPFSANPNPTIFYIGVLNKRKGVDDLIRAFQLVKTEIPCIKLKIAGIGPDLDKLIKLTTDLELEKDVEFIGFVSEENKFSYLKSIDVFVLATYWESFPIVLLEAMACGKPIITTEVAGNSFAVINGVNGFLVNPGDWRQISEKLIYLFKNREVLEKMGVESKKRALLFNWNTVAVQTKDIYLEITEKITENNY